MTNYESYKMHYEYLENYVVFTSDLFEMYGRAVLESVQSEKPDRTKISAIVDFINDHNVHYNDRYIKKHVKESEDNYVKN